MEVTTVAKMHVDDLPPRLKFALDQFVKDSKAIGPLAFVWVIFTNLRMVGAYLTADEAHSTAAGIERAYAKSLLPLEIIDVLAQGEKDLVTLIDDIIERGLLEEAEQRPPIPNEHLVKPDIPEE